MSLNQPLESNITRSILKYLKTVDNCFAWKAHGGYYGVAGIPDIVCCLNGHFLALEVKRPGNKPTKQQAAVLGKINRAGGRAFVVYGVNEVREIVKEILTVEKKNTDAIMKGGDI